MFSHILADNRVGLLLIFVPAQYSPLVVSAYSAIALQDVLETIKINYIVIVW